MKATYRRGNIEVRRRTFVLGGVILLCFFILLVAPVRGAFSRALYAVAPGMWDTGASISAMWQGLWDRVHTKTTLINENTALKERVLRMETQVLDRNLLEEKVSTLEEDFGRQPRDNRTLAYVLAGPGRSPYDTLAVDVGTDVGVTVGDYVAYVGAGVIGKVAEVYGSSAKVKLFSSFGEETDVLLGSSLIPVTARGRGMGNFEASVPAGSAVLVGEDVRLPPGSLILGKIEAIESKPSEPAMRVLFRTTFNIAEIRSVEIIR